MNLFSSLMVVDVPCVYAKKSIRSLCKKYKSIIKLWIRRKKYKSSSSTQHNYHHRDQQEHDVNNKAAGRNMSGIHNRYAYSDDDEGMVDSAKLGCCLYRHRSLDNSIEANQASTSRNNSRRGKINYARSKSGESYDVMAEPSSWHRSGSFKMAPNLQTRNGSSRSLGGAPIMYSSSSGMLKPPPIEKKLECTLEELCYGCNKKIKITREVLTDTGGIVEEQEILTIKVKPGWKKGTKITFEGKGNERPGAYREDIIFFITEKRHQLFRRDGDDLELCIEIPLLKALTGCTIPVPLLGGEEMSLTVDDVICPGYQQIITGQGMAISREQGKRGNLRVTFLVEFPTHLTDNQRCEVVDILKDSC